MTRVSKSLSTVTVSEDSERLVVLHGRRLRLYRQLAHPRAPKLSAAVEFSAPMHAVVLHGRRLRLHQKLAHPRAPKLSAAVAFSAPMHAVVLHGRRLRLHRKLAHPRAPRLSAAVVAVEWVSLVCHMGCEYFSLLKRLVVVGVLLVVPAAGVGENWWVVRSDPGILIVVGFVSVCGDPWPLWVVPPVVLHRLGLCSVPVALVLSLRRGVMVGSVAVVGLARVVARVAIAIAIAVAIVRVAIAIAISVSISTVAVASSRATSPPPHLYLCYPSSGFAASVPQ